MFVDELLVRRLEAQNRWFYAGLSSEPHAYLDLGETFAFFAGEGSPHTLGAGAFTDEELWKIQRFYRGRAQHWQALTTPFTGVDSLQSLLRLGAVPDQWENVYLRPTSEPLPALELPPQLEVREAKAEEVGLWANHCTLAYFGEMVSPAAKDFLRLMGQATNFRRYFAFWDGRPAAVASLTLGLGVGYLGDMRTLPEFRARGIQTALIHHRLRAAQAEADVVLVGTAPGNASSRNVVRAGFQIAYSQLGFRVPVR
jgi:GNAT superfamily N-acetyltransferase